MPLSDQEQLNEIQDKLKEQVGWTAFTWLIGIFLVINMAVFGYVIANQKDIRNDLKTHEDENVRQFSEVKSTYTDIQSRLAAIQADMEWLKRNIK